MCVCCVLLLLVRRRQSLQPPLCEYLLTWSHGFMDLTVSTMLPLIVLYKIKEIRRLHTNQYKLTGQGPDLSTGFTKYH